MVDITQMIINPDINITQTVFDKYKENHPNFNINNLFASWKDGIVKRDTLLLMSINVNLNNLDKIKLLLKNGADPNLVNTNGDIPIIKTLELGYPNNLNAIKL